MLPSDKDQDGLRAAPAALRAIGFADVRFGFHAPPQSGFRRNDEQNQSFPGCASRVSTQAEQDESAAPLLFSKPLSPVVRPAMQVSDRQNQHVMLHASVDHAVRIPA
jgi:hypothetical protein